MVSIVSSLWEEFSVALRRLLCQCKHSCLPDGTISPLFLPVLWALSGPLEPIWGAQGYWGEGGKPCCTSRTCCIGSHYLNYLVGSNSTTWSGAVLAVTAHSWFDNWLQHGGILSWRYSATTLIVVMWLFVQPLDITDTIFVMLPYICKIQNATHSFFPIALGNQHFLFDLERVFSCLS